MEDIVLESSGRRNPFSFDLSYRNDALAKMGVQLPPARSTGTTIVGLLFNEGVLIGADSRATSGSIVGDKFCLKLHYLTKSIYACGAGTAADLEQTADMLSSNLRLMELNTGRKARGIAALRIAKQHLFKYMGYVGAYLIIAGVDFFGPFIYSVHAHGSSYKDPYMADGSGSLAALGVLEPNFKMKMPLEEALDLLKRALMAGMEADLNSGNSYTYAIIRKDGFEMKQFNIPPFCARIPKQLQYHCPPKATRVLKEKKYEIMNTVTL
ncbi:multicatalytic endopeptidase family protein [Trichuris suis]|nr:multicatalytic endopeptidase family protein [Trichuris suis]